VTTAEKMSERSDTAVFRKSCRTRRVSPQLFIYRGLEKVIGCLMKRLKNMCCVVCCMKKGGRMEDEKTRGLFIGNPTGFSGQGLRFPERMQRSSSFKRSLSRRQQ
jgi:hypothetical protein